MTKIASSYVLENSALMAVHPFSLCHQAKNLYSELQQAKLQVTKGL